jgi:uncharacterized protein (DUF2147 family)
MKKLYILAALLMASTAAHAGNGISFDVNGKHVRVEMPRNCDSLSCLKISAPGLSGADFGLKSRHVDDDDTVADARPAPVQNPTPAVEAPAPRPVASAPAPTAVASTAPAIDTVTQIAAPVAVAPAPVAPAPVAAAPISDPTTPLGIWATEDNKGNVRIEQCGQNLCGFAVNTGAKVLISMKPTGTKWTGRIHDPDSGSDYDSTIAMKGIDTLKVQGCAFGGMFCGGQTWKRVS